MCGHVGVAGQLALKDEKLLKHLLMFDYFRGPDSTGLAAVRGNGDVYIAKLATHPINLFHDRRFTAALNGAQSRAFIGHNRATTRGATIDMNAHPFVFNHIVGAHNGTLEHSCIADLEKAAGDKYNVDSQALFAAIAAVGVEAAIKMSQGAWSLVWYDMKEKTLNFLRNKERPMWYAFTKDFSRIIWASQWEFIHAAALSNEYELHTWTENDRSFQFRFTDEDVMYSFNLDELGRKNEQPKPKVKKIEGKPKYVSMTGNYGGSNVTGFFPVRQDNGSSYQKTANTNSGGTKNSNGGGRANTPGSGSDRTHVSVSSRTGTPDNPFANLITKEEFDQLNTNGCAWCQSPVHWGDTGIIVMENAGAMIGPCCTHRTDSNRVMTKVDLMIN